MRLVPEYRRDPPINSKRKTRSLIGKSNNLYNKIISSITQTDNYSPFDSIRSEYYNENYNIHQSLITTHNQN